MSKKVVVVKPEDHKWINKKKSDMELKSNAVLVNRLIRFYEKHQEVEPDFK